MASNDTVDSKKVAVKDGLAESRAMIAAARKALDERENFEYGNLKLEEEFYELGLFTKHQRFVAVDCALHEIKPEGRCGPDPPGNISFRPYMGRTLYAFKWHSSDFKSLMYIKFCLAGTTGSEILVLYSFHKDRP